MTVVLASASPRRSELLEKLGLSFAVRAADIDEESVLADSPEALVLALSAAKAQKVADDETPDTLVIAADTVVVLDSTVLGKPTNAASAFTMLSALSGRWHEVYTGVSVQSGDRRVAFCERSEVCFRPLSDVEIHNYIKTGEPMDKAGAYGIQGYGALLVSALRGDYFSVMGLPLCRLGQCLAEFGLDLLDEAAKKEG